MIHRDIGVILNGHNEVLSVELQSNNPRFYYLRYFSCTRNPQYYTVVAIKDPVQNYFKCFRCGKTHKLKSYQHAFINIFNDVYNMLFYGVSAIDIALHIKFVEAALRQLKLNDFIVV